MNITTLTMGQAKQAVLTGSPALGKTFPAGDHRVGILDRVVGLLAGLFYAPAASRLVIDVANLIPETNGLWSPALVSQAVRRAFGTDYGETVKDGRRDKRSGLIVPTGATIPVTAAHWLNYSTSVPAGSKPIAKRGASFRSGVVQGMLRPALNNLTATNAAGSVVAATIPGADVASSYIIGHGPLADSLVIVTAYRIDPSVSA